ncbi:MAG: hypothetical protein M3Q53_06135 [Actinomycetota bacterium]|nr:hypothetical protein [Actinomycetota bacterium]
MPIPEVRARAAAVVGFVATTIMFTSIAEAKSIPAELRVVDSNGDILAEQTQYTTTSETRVKTDPEADCFGPDTGGSGKPAAVPGSTALSQLLDATGSDRDVKPVSVSDSFDFGLAICGIGEAVSPQTGFLYLKQDHVGAPTGGDQTLVKKGDEILWFLIEDFEAPTPDELVLKAPATAKAGSEIKVKVLSYADDGKKSPAEGVEVTDADAPTNARGVTTVPAESDLVLVQATREGSIPSNVGEVCTTKIAKCPRGYAATIGGTDGDDKIAAGKLAETILAGDGDDQIDATKAGSAPDLVKCGAGDDTITIDGGEPAGPAGTRIAGCERVRAGR